MIVYHFANGHSIEVSDDSGEYKKVDGEWKWFENKYTHPSELAPLKPIFAQSENSVPYNALRLLCIERGW